MKEETQTEKAWKRGRDYGIFISSVVWMFFYVLAVVALILI